MVIIARHEIPRQIRDAQKPPEPQVPPRVLKTLAGKPLRPCTDTGKPIPTAAAALEPAAEPLIFFCFPHCFHFLPSQPVFPFSGRMICRAYRSEHRSCVPCPVHLFPQGYPPGLDNHFLPPDLKRTSKNFPSFSMRSTSSVFSRQFCSN